jgi:hypothetical protein
LQQQKKKGTLKEGMAGCPALRLLAFLFSVIVLQVIDFLPEIAF